MNASIATTSASSHSARRHDVYGLIHKGIRAFMLDTLSRLGRVDADCPADVAAALGQVGALLEQLRNHLRHEDAFLHTALEQRRPGSSVITAVEHSDHLRAFTELQSLLARCGEGPASEREA